ncbi:MAG: hypothetical protein ACTSVU_09460 [Promethearchaeota archaeon]
MEQSESDIPYVKVEFGCSIEEKLESLQLIYSEDQGNSWYQSKMLEKNGKYSVVVNLIPDKDITFLFKAINPKKEIFIENNHDQYYVLKINPEKSENIPLSIISNDISPKFIPPSQKNAIDSSKTVKLPSEFQPQFNPFLTLKTKPNIRSSLQSYRSGKKFPSSDSSISENTPATPSDQTISISSNNMQKDQESSSPKEISKNFNGLDISGKIQDNNPINLRPIIAYNPFPADYGDIEIKHHGISTFSNLVDASLNEPNQKKHSFIKRNLTETSQICAICHSKIKSTWKICPVCGNKK